MSNLRSEKEMRPLLDAAQSRAESDWIVGINATRAASAIANMENKKSFHVVNVGRVQTPTLALIVNREREIEKFVPKPFWSISCTFAADQTAQFAGQYVCPKSKSSRINDQAEVDSAMQCIEKAKRNRATIKARDVLSEVFSFVRCKLFPIASAVAATRSQTFQHQQYSERDAQAG